MSKVSSLLSSLALIVIFGCIALFGGDFAIKAPIQWYNGKCSQEYARQYRAKFQWLRPTCELEEEDEVTEDDIAELQDRLADLKSQVENTERLLRESRRKMEEKR